MLGVAVGKAELYGTWRDPETEAVRWHGAVPNTAAVPAAPPPSPVLAAARTLRAVPGFGPVTAAALAACLVDKQFTHPDQFVASLGLDIRVHQSGRRIGQFGLSKHGDAELRRLLYIAALGAAQSRDTTFATRYARPRAGQGPGQHRSPQRRRSQTRQGRLVPHRSQHHLRSPAR